MDRLKVRYIVNDVQIEVEDLHATVARLKEAGADFRNKIVTGNGGMTD